MQEYFNAINYENPWTNEEKEKHKKQQEYNEFENFKAKRRKFANYHNRKYGGGKNG